VTELFRLLRYARPYTAPLLGSVLLMAIAGVAHALIALLIKPIFDRAAVQCPGARHHASALRAGRHSQRVDSGGVRHSRCLSRQGRE
jgi:ABC-type multidrug transport system fused ATPase/permease subunit